MANAVNISTKYLIGILLFFLALSVSGCSEEQVIEQEAPIRPVKYTTLKSGTQNFSRSFTGTAVASKESSLSFKVPGTVKSIHVKVGDLVESGTLLAQLDETDLQVELEAARANLKTAEADKIGAVTTVNTTRSNYYRIEKLYESNNISLSEFEQARGDYETAEAQLLAAKSQITTSKTKLQAADNQIKYTRISAPFAGVVNTIAIEENEEVSSGSEILSMSGLGDLEVVVNLSDLYISKVQKGMTCEVIFSTLPDIPFTGTITEIPYTSADSPTYLVKISVQATDKRLRPGMATEVLFNFNDSKEGNDLYLSVDAAGEDSNGNFVFLIEKENDDIGVVKKRAVTLGALTASGFRVKDGLSEGDIVATSGLQILLEGMQVKLLENPTKNW